MQQVIKALEEESVGIAHLRRSSPAYVKVMEYDKLPATIEQVFGKAKAVIVLYEFHTSKHRTEAGKGHYICLVRHGKTVEYFSSYGLPPEAEIAATHSDKTKLSKILGPKFRLNKTKFQSKYHSATCGRWAFARALLADLPLTKFQTYFGRKFCLKTPDDIVAISTIFAIR